MDAVEYRLTACFDKMMIIGVTDSRKSGGACRNNHAQCSSFIFSYSASIYFNPQSTSVHQLQCLMDTSSELLVFNS